MVSMRTCRGSSTRSRATWSIRSRSPWRSHRGELGVVVDTDEQHAAVDRELGEVPGELLVLAFAGRQLPFEVQAMLLGEDSLVERVAKLGLVGRKPPRSPGRLQTPRVVSRDAAIPHGRVLVRPMRILAPAVPAPARWRPRPPKANPGGTAPGPG